jgi:hypothetical protein
VEQFSIVVHGTMSGDFGSRTNNLKQLCLNSALPECKVRIHSPI